MINKDSAPGCDGFTPNFYIHLSKQIRPILFKCFSDAINKGCLGVTQKRGIITLLPKDPSLPRDQLNNWRPVTLTNTDYKIFSKMLANRLSICLDSIIDKNQVGFMKGRNIASQIRTIDDIISLAREKGVEGIVTSLDFQKATRNIMSLCCELY